MNPRTIIVTKIPCFLYAALAVLLWLLPACEKEAPTGQLSPVKRTELTSATIPSGREKPHLFKLLRVTLPAGQTIEYATGESLVFQVSGSQTVTVNDQVSTLHPSQGLRIETGMPAKFTSQGKEEPSVYLHFLLIPAPQADRTIEVEPATIAELYRTSDPITDLAANPQVFTLARLDFPPATAESAPHDRTGAALYYVLSGTGQFTSKETTEQKQAGSVVYEPSGVFHQWANPGDQPLEMIVASISSEGTPARSSQ